MHEVASNNIMSAYETDEVPGNLVSTLIQNLEDPLHQAPSKSLKQRQPKIL